MNRFFGQLTRLFLLLGIVGLVACNSSNKQTATQPQTFTLGVMRSVDYLPFAVAKAQGYFDSLGVDLKIVTFSSPHERDAALQAGGLDATVTDYTSVALQQAGGLPVKLWMKCDGSFSLITSTEANIKSIEELKGKRIALSSNTVIEYATDKLLESAGITPAEVTKVEIQKIPLRKEALSKGEVDAAFLPEPIAAVAKHEGLHSLTNTIERGITITGVAVWGEDLTPKAELLKKVQQGYDMAISYMKAHPREEWISVLAQELGIKPEMTKGILLPEYTAFERPKQNEISSVVAWLVAKKLVPDTYTGADLVLP